MKQDGYKIVTEVARYTPKQIQILVIKTIEKQLGTRVKNPNQKLSDLGMDSLDSIEIIMSLEEEFNIDISEELVNSYAEKLGNKMTVKTMIQIVMIVLKNPDRNKERVASKLLRKLR